MSFEEQWKQKLETIPEHILPWEREQLPNIPSNPSDEEVIAFLKVARPLIERGRWWYFCMGAVRAWKSVLSEQLGRIAVVLTMLLIHQVYALWYLQILQQRADTVGSDVFGGEATTLEVLIPWSIAQSMDDLMLRHERSIALYYQAKTIPWTIQRYSGTYPKSTLSLRLNATSTTAKRYRTSQELELLEAKVLSSLELKELVTELKNRSKAIG